MTPQDYCEWSDFSGLYVANHSHEDRYRTYAAKLSPEGLATVIVTDFLEDNLDGIDVQKWRDFCVYELSGGDRLRMTSEALQAVGAKRLADAVAKVVCSSRLEMTDIDWGDQKAIEALAKEMPVGDMLTHLRTTISIQFPDLADEMGIKREPPKPPSGEYESREELIRLLEQFVSAHQATLQADIDRYGDPRLLPGFTPEKRHAELDAEQEKYEQIQRQHDDIRKLENVVSRIKKFRGKPGSTTACKLRNNYTKLIRRNAKISAEDRTPEMERALAESKAFQEAHPAIFKRDESFPADLPAKLDALGEYDEEGYQGRLSFSWDKPNGFANDWVPVSLRLSFPAKRAADLNQLLAIVEQIRSKLPVLLEDWKRQLLADFREVYEDQLAEWDEEFYDYDADGKVTDDSILTEVDRCMISMATGKNTSEVNCSLSFAVGWDEDHGCQLDWDPATLTAESTSSGTEAQLDLGKVTISNAGPTISLAELDEFTAKTGVPLPNEYRQFMVQFNGGEPKPNHLVVSRDGFKFHADVIRFFSLSGEDSLESHRKLPNSNVEWPKGVQPIGRVKVAGLVKNEPDSLLAIRPTGEVLLLQPDFFEEEKRGGLVKLSTALLEGDIKYAPVAAKSLQLLFEKKLKKAPKVELPDWLTFIQQGNEQGFARWVEQGGKLTEKFTHPLIGFPLTVVDYLTLEAPVELIRPLMENGSIKPKQIRTSWQRVTGCDVDRFVELMPILPKSLWTSVMATAEVWQRLPLLEKMGEAGINLDGPVNEEGSTPLHLAVQAENTEAIKWLLARGADPKKPDKFGRTAFDWAQTPGDQVCMRLLKGQPEQPVPTSAASADDPGFAVLMEVGSKLPEKVSLIVMIEIRTPPVRRMEKMVYPKGCHYTLKFDVTRDQVTFSDVNSPMQDYFTGMPTVKLFFCPITQWPELTPLWETLRVVEFDWKQAGKKAYQPGERPELMEAARSVLQQAFDVEEAKARGVLL